MGYSIVDVLFAGSDTEGVGRTAALDEFDDARLLPIAAGEGFCLEPEADAGGPNIDGVRLSAVTSSGNFTLVSGWSGLAVYFEQWGTEKRTVSAGTNVEGDTHFIWPVYDSGATWPALMEVPVGEAPTADDLTEIDEDDLGFTVDALGALPSGFVPP